MKRKWLMLVAAFMLIMVVCILFGKRDVPLKVNGQTVAFARTSFLPAWNNGSVDVYVGKEKAFSLFKDFWDCPVFIYPFADGKRFLCDYDFDVSMLDFVVDFTMPATNKMSLPPWPTDGYVRESLLSGATNVVFNTKAIVRLPTYEELQEVSGYLAGTTPRNVKPASLSIFDFATNKFLLLDLATNRQSFWPTN